MYTDKLHPTSYRALVTYSNHETGEIRVRIPSISGLKSDLPLSFIGRKKREHYWDVPSIGEQIVVTFDDENLSNVFWVQGGAQVHPTVYGVFHDRTTQTNPVANVARAVQLGYTDYSSGVTIESGSRIKVSEPGTYNLQFSLQLDKTDSGEDHVFIWLRHNGVDEPWTNTTLTMPKNNAKLVAAWNFINPMSAGDYAQIMWLSDDTSMRIYTSPASTSPAMPGIPSAIVTITRL